MSRSRRPWMKFYPSDWRADPALRMCSIGARGLWAEMLCLMHEAEPYGSLLVNGQRITEKQLASLACVSNKEAAEFIVELECSGVFSRDSDGTIYSRRMRRDLEKEQKDQENGKAGGNPALKGGVNPPDKGEDKAQNLELRTENKEKKKDIGAVADATRPNTGKVFDEEFWRVYPKRDGANPKAPARKAFLTAVKSGHDPAAIVGGAARYAASAAKSNQVGTPYVAQAVTWLRQSRWEDYPVEAVVETTGPPQPPNPSLPSHDELKRKYEQANERQNPPEGTGIRAESAGPREATERRPESFGGAAHDQTRVSGMASMGAILHRIPGLRAMGDEAGEDGRGSGDDGPGTVARVV
jgi:hypothetical protein